MFEKREVMEFINRIINASNISEEEIIQNVTNFYEYLVLTKMCDDDLLEKISKIISCLSEILIIKCCFGYVDVNVLLLKPDSEKKLVKKPQNKKHYGHYESSDSSSFCGTTRVVSRC